MEAISLFVFFSFSTPAAITHSDNFSVFAANAAQGQRLAAECETARRQIALHLLGHELPQWPRRAVVQLIDSASTARGLASPARPSLGYLEHRVWLFGSVNDVAREILRHEISHLILASLAGPVPAWLDEGIAAQNDGQEHSALLRARLSALLGQTDRQLSPLWVLDLARIGPDDLDAYAFSASLVQFAISQRKGNAQETLALLRHAKNANDLAAALGYSSPQELEFVWRRWAKAKRFAGQQAPNVSISI